MLCIPVHCEQASELQPRVSGPYFLSVSLAPLSAKMVALRHLTCSFLVLLLLVLDSRADLLMHEHLRKVQNKDVQEMIATKIYGNGKSDIDPLWQVVHTTVAVSIPSPGRCVHLVEVMIYGATVVTTKGAGAATMQNFARRGKLAHLFTAHLNNSPPLDKENILS